MKTHKKISSLFLYLTSIHLPNNCDCLQSIRGVPKIKDGYNPATWMLEISSTGFESKLNVDFADIYANSDLYRYVPYDSTILVFLYFLFSISESSLTLNHHAPHFVS